MWGHKRVGVSRAGATAIAPRHPAVLTPSRICTAEGTGLLNRDIVPIGEHASFTTWSLDSMSNGDEVHIRFGLHVVSRVVRLGNVQTDSHE